MPRKRNTSWKQAERRVAALFNSKRTILSGMLSHHRDNETNADTDHPTLFIDIKQRRSHGVWAWYNKAKDEAAKEARRQKKTPKLPVIALDQVRSKGSLICVHSDDLLRFCRIFLEQKKSSRRKK